jgi:CDP-paratose 2-epimerase
MSAGPVVILGGAGFIGANLANRLLAAGTPVRVFDNLSRPGTERNVEWLRGTHDSLVDVRIGDVRNEAALRAALADASDVFHFAAQVAVTTSLDEPAADFDVNARGTLNVLEALRERANPPLLFFTSTNKVYGALPELHLVEQPTRYALRGGDTYENGVGEDQPLDFHSPYGCSKGSADQYVLDYARSFGLRTVVFRMSCIYGPRQHGNEDQGWVAHFIKKALNYEPLTIYGDGKQVRDILFIDDLVDAFLAARRDPTRVSGRAFNIGGGPERTLSLLELLDRIDELLRRRPEVSYAAPRFGDQRYYVSDIRRFEKATGWRPRVDVHRGLRELYAWLATSADKRRAAFAPVETRP